MNTEETIFTDALKRTSGPERAAFLDQACAHNAPLRKQVEDLLRAHEGATGILEAPAVGVALTSEIRPSSEGVGSTIGPYKLLEQIGEGGMGVVYMAEQRVPVTRKVALKIIKLGMDTRQVIARFEAERQALALMDHPNIAKVLEAGTTEFGRPYFVMELVRGIPITRYCDEHHVEPRQRLELFVQVCQAVQHAHQKGIIHRDIKPTNVLVAEFDEKPVAKVIDFGVAKAIGQHLTDKTMFTAFGQVIGTIEYMSPEHAKLNQLDIDTRSDIYSLGVLLYELLTGETPLDRQRLQSAAFDEMLRIIREEEPVRPSTRLSTTHSPSIAANRGLEPKKLSGLVHGELDWIVMKSLEKDRNRRYETANGFAMDVRRYLDDEAVQACPPSTAYRVRKFARRHKGRLAIAGVLGACLLAGVVLLVVNDLRLKAEQARTRAESERTRTQFERAQDQLARADGNLGIALAALDQIFMTEIEDRVRRDHRLTQDGRRFLQKGLEFYEQFAVRNSAHSGLQAETARAYRRAGELQMMLTRWPEAESAFRKAIPLFETIPVQSPGFENSRREFAFCLEGLSRALSQQQRAGEALRAAERALPYWEAVAASGTERPDARVPLAHCLGQLGLLLALDGRYDEAERTLTRVLDLYAKLKNDFPHDRTYQQEWAYAHSCLGYSVMRPTKRLGEAEQHFRQAISAYRAMAQEAPDDFWYPRCVANELMNLGRMLKEMGQSESVEKLNREAIELEERMLARGPPAINEHRHLLAGYVGELADLLTDSDRFSEAEAAFRRSAMLRVAIIADLGDPDDDPERQNQRRLLSQDYVGLIETLSLAAQQAAADKAQPEDDRKAAATAFRTRAREIERDARRAGHLVAGGLNELAWRVVVKPGADAEDVAWAIEMASKSVEMAPSDGNIWNTLGVARYRAGEFKQAVADLTNATVLGKGGSSVDFFFLAMSHWQLGDKGQARQWYENAVQWMDKYKPRDNRLRGFRTEAEELLKITDPKPTTGPQSK